MASHDVEKLRTLLARKTTAIKTLVDDNDLGDLALVTRVLEISNDLNDDILTLLRDMMEKRQLDYERDRDRFDDREDRDRDSYRDRDRGRDSYRGRGSGGYGRR